MILTHLTIFSFFDGATPSSALDGFSGFTLHMPLAMFDGFAGNTVTNVPLRMLLGIGT